MCAAFDSHSTDFAKQGITNYAVLPISKTSEHHRTLENQLRQDLQAARSAAAAASQSADILRGRCDALEGQLSGLQDLPAQLEAALKRSEEFRMPADVRPKRRRSKQ